MFKPFLFEFGLYKLFEYDSLFCNKYSNSYVRVINDISEIDFDFPFLEFDKFVELFNAGVTVFVYVLNGRAEGVMFGCMGSCFIRGIRYSLCLSHKSVYCFWVQVSNSMRNKGLFSKLFRVFCSYYSGLKIYFLVRHNNTVMSSFLRRRGAVSVQNIYFFLFLFLSIHILKTDNSIQVNLKVAHKINCLTRVI